MVQLMRRLRDDVEYVYDQFHPRLKMILNQKLPEPMEKLFSLLKHEFLKKEFNTLCNIMAIKTINSTLNRLVADAAPKI